MACSGFAVSYLDCATSLISVGEGGEDIVAACSSSVTCKVTPDDALLLSRVGDIAQQHDVPTRPLHLQALLQLPRVADSAGLLPIGLLNQLLDELALELPARPEWVINAPPTSPRDFKFHEMDWSRANDLMLRFHYLRSPRSDGRAYGLSTPSGELAALCVASPLDVGSIELLMATHGRETTTVRVISRVFAFPSAPKNSISFLLSRVCKREASLGVTDLVTYVNPNMGFRGESYRASGWFRLGSEPGTKYRYLDQRYITDRELHARYGRRTDSDYFAMLGHRFAISIMSLNPLLLFARNIDSYASGKHAR